MKLTICVVEDNIILADVLCSLLIKSGFFVTEPAISYNSALKIIVDEKPDLLLLDIDLSGDKSGIDLAWKVSQDFHLPFAFLTAYNDESIMFKAKQTNPFAYFVKPIENEVLIRSIKAGYNLFMSKNSNLQTKLK